MRPTRRPAGIAEKEGHHLDLAAHYIVVEVTLWTHAIGALPGKDLLLAGKLDQVA